MDYEQNFYKVNQICNLGNEKSWLRVRRGKSEGESLDSHTSTRLSCSARYLNHLKD